MPDFLLYILLLNNISTLAGRYVLYLRFYGTKRNDLVGRLCYEVKITRNICVLFRLYRCVHLAYSLRHNNLYSMISFLLASQFLFINATTSSNLFPKLLRLNKMSVSYIFLVVCIKSLIVKLYCFK
jgi:hypothetical protein